MADAAAFLLDLLLALHAHLRLQVPLLRSFTNLLSIFFATVPNDDMLLDATPDVPKKLPLFYVIKPLLPIMSLLRRSPCSASTRSSCSRRRRAAPSSSASSTRRCPTSAHGWLACLHTASHPAPRRGQPCDRIKGPR